MRIIILLITILISSQTFVTAGDRKIDSIPEEMRTLRKEKNNDVWNDFVLSYAKFVNERNSWQHVCIPALKPSPGKSRYLRNHKTGLVPQSPHPRLEHSTLSHSPTRLNEIWIQAWLRRFRSRQEHADLDETQCKPVQSHWFSDVSRPRCTR